MGLYPPTIPTREAQRPYRGMAGPTRQHGEPGMMATVRVTILFLTLTAASAAAEPSGARLSVNEYVQRLEACAERLRSASDPRATEVSVAAALAECESRLADLEVDTPAGPVHAPNAWISDLAELAKMDVSSATGARREVLARLDALHREVSAGSGLEPAPDAEAVLAGVLSRPEFGFRRPTDRESRFLEWLRRALERLGEAVARAMEAIMNRLRDLLGFLVPDEESGAGASLGRALAIILGAAVLLLLVYLLARSVSLVRRRLAAEPPGEEEITQLPHPDELLHRAADFRERGEFRAAVRCLYLALLAFLENQGWVRYDRSKTNWEYARELAPSSPLRERFVGLTETFDRVWYGSEAATPDDCATFEAGYRDLSASGAGT